MTEKLAEAFQRDMYDCSIRYKKRTGPTPTPYHQLIGPLGGVETARDLALAPRISNRS